MKRIVLPQPPDATAYRNDHYGFMVASTEWMRRVKGLLEDSSRINDSPLGQAFLATNFTTNTVVSAASTLPDVANALASLIQAFTDRGVVSASVSRSDG